MPKVTLLGNPGRTYSFAFGKQMIHFESGVAQEVSVAAALELSRRKNFRVEEMPEIIVPAGHNVEEPKHIPPGQNVLGSPRQARFEQWPLN